VTFVRWLVAGIGGAVLVGAVVLLVTGVPWPAVTGLVFIGLALVLGTLFERIHYKRVASRPPGGGFLATGERFIDPATGRLVEVHFRPETGERIYVDAGAPRHDGA